MTIHYPYRQPMSRTPAAMRTRGGFHAGKHRLTFSGLGKFDWAGTIGTAVSVYTGQPNALNNPTAQVAAATAAPVQVYNQPAQMGPPPPLPTPWFKKPATFLIGGGAVLLLTALFLKVRKGRR